MAHAPTTPHILVHALADYLPDLRLRYLLAGLATDPAGVRRTMLAARLILAAKVQQALGIARGQPPPRSWKTESVGCSSEHETTFEVGGSAFGRMATNRYRVRLFSSGIPCSVAHELEPPDIRRFRLDVINEFPSAAALDREQSWWKVVSVDHWTGVIWHQKPADYAVYLGFLQAEDAMKRAFA